MSAIVKRCGCGREYDARAWRELRLCGAMEDGEGGYLELRDCAGCHSTIAIPAGGFWRVLFANVVRLIRSIGTRSVA